MFNRTECSNGRANELWDQLERRHQRNPTSDVAERFVGVLATSPLYLFVRERSAALPGAYIYENIQVGRALRTMASKKHHYIPKCYLKAWTGADGLLCEYKKVAGRIAVQRRHPSATGWSDSLYSVESLPPEMVDAVEEVWFKRVDQEASDALNFYTRGTTLPNNKLLTGWSRFLMSLMRRHPGKIDELWRKCEAQLREEFAPRDNETDDEKRARAVYEANPRPLLGRLFLGVVQKTCDLPNLGQHLNSMKQSVVMLTSGTRRFMTSDNPLFVTNGLLGDGAFALLPISPRTVWIATNTDTTHQRIIEKIRTGELVELLNIQVVSQAHTFAYAICENQLAFVEKHISFDPQPDRFRLDEAELLAKLGARDP